MTIKIDALNKMIDKAKTKKDGIYSSNGNKYLVYKNGVVAFVGDDRTVYRSVGFACFKISERFKYREYANNFLKKNKKEIIEMLRINQ